jgi:hypothetical protein
MTGMQKSVYQCIGVSATKFDILKCSTICALLSPCILFISIIIAMFVLAPLKIDAREPLLWGFALDGYPITTDK